MITVQEIKDARHAKALGEMTPAQRREAIDGVLKHLYFLKGATVADNVQPEIDGAVRELEQKMSGRWRYLTMGEIKLSLEGGVTGGWGKDTRLTISNYIYWVDSFVNCPERKEAVEDLNRGHKRAAAVDPAQLLPTEALWERNERAMQEGLRQSWETFKATGSLDITFDGYAAVLYDYLVRRGLFRVSEQNVEAARRKAEARYRRMSKDFASILNNAVRFNGEDVYTKRVLLEMCFSTLRKKGMELAL